MYTISRNNASLTLRNLLTSVLFEIVVAAIAGIAWWTILKERPAANGWGIAASLMYILIFPPANHHFPGTVGLQRPRSLSRVGLITFSRRSFVSKLEVDSQWLIARPHSSPAHLSASDWSSPASSPAKATIWSSLHAAPTSCASWRLNWKGPRHSYFDPGHRPFRSRCCRLRVRSAACANHHRHPG